MIMTTYPSNIIKGNIMRRKFLPYQEAKAFVHKLNLRTRREWEGYCKKGEKPQNIPAAPYNYYKNSGWINWYDWIGIEYLDSNTKNKPLEKLISIQRDFKKAYVSLNALKQDDYNWWSKTWVIFEKITPYMMDVYRILIGDKSVKEQMVLDFLKIEEDLDRSEFELDYGFYPLPYDTYNRLHGLINTSLHFLTYRIKEVEDPSYDDEIPF